MRYSCTVFQQGTFVRKLSQWESLPFKSHLESTNCCWERLSCANHVKFLPSVPCLKIISANVHLHSIIAKTSLNQPSCRSPASHSRFHGNQWWGGRVNSWCFPTIRRTGNMWGLRGGSPLWKREKRPFWEREGGGGGEHSSLSQIDHVPVLFDVMGPRHGCCVYWGYF